MLTGVGEIACKIAKRFPIIKHERACLLLHCVFCASGSGRALKVTWQRVYCEQSDADR